MRHKFRDIAGNRILAIQSSSKVVVELVMEVVLDSLVEYVREVVFKPSSRSYSIS